MKLSKTCNRNSKHITKADEHWRQYHPQMKPSRSLASKWRSVSARETVSAKVTWRSEEGGVEAIVARGVSVVVEAAASFFAFHAS